MFWNSSSDNIGVPIFCAVVSFDPGDCPAIKKFVLLVTDEVADAPNALTWDSASLRDILSRVPVITKVRPFHG